MTSKGGPYNGKPSHKPCYLYPAPPDRLSLFTNHRYVERPKTAAVNYLDYMLTKTSLTTQKVSHTNIQKIGKNLYDEKVSKFLHERENAVKQAIAKTTHDLHRKFQKELHEKLLEAEMEKGRALENQKEYYEELARRTEDNRDMIENERNHQLIRKLLKDKEDALKKQWEHAEKIKAEEIAASLASQHRKLRSEAALLREEEVARALRVAREQFVTKARGRVEGARSECDDATEEKLERQRKLHSVEIQRLNERIATLNQESMVYRQKQRSAQKDFVEMETDYSKFVDLTDAPPCHSDYLISPRKHKHGVGASFLHQGCQTNLIALDQDTQNIQTDIQISAVL